MQYDTSARTALWARAATGGGNQSRFYGVVMDSAAGSGGAFTAVGYQYGTLPFTYGGRVTATGGISGAYTHNAVVVEYR